MKKTAIAAALILLTFTAAACGQKTAGTVQTTEANTETATTEAATTEAATTETDAAASEPTEFANKLKLVVKSKDLDGLIEMASFPVYISSVESNGGVVESIEEFGEIDPNSIFTADFMDAIISYDLKKLQKTEAGYVLGEGTPNVTFEERGGAFKITGLNIK